MCCRYDAFGNHEAQTGTANNPYRYAGYDYDEESGLYYLKARMYNPEIARFLQEDTYWGEQTDPLSLNLYTYVLNNPLIYWDPNGKAAGDLQVNGHNIGNTTVIDGESYGSIRDFANAVGGTVSIALDGTIIVTIGDYTIRIPPDYTSMENGELRNAVVYKNGKEQKYFSLFGVPTKLKFTKVANQSNPQYSTVLIQLQIVVNMASEKMTLNMAYELGPEGVVCHGSGHFWFRNADHANAV